MLFPRKWSVSQNMSLFIYSLSGLSTSSSTFNVRLFGYTRYYWFWPICWLNASGFSLVICRCPWLLNEYSHYLNIAMSCACAYTIFVCRIWLMQWNLTVLLFHVVFQMILRWVRSLTLFLYIITFIRARKALWRILLLWDMYVSKMIMHVFILMTSIRKDNFS